MASEPEFTVSVDGAFEEDGVWVIDTAVTYQEGLGPQRRQALLGEVRMALLKGIAREGVRGRGLGAKKVRVTLDDPGRRLVKRVPENLMIL